MDRLLPRKLTVEEAELVHWLLEHGTAEARGFLPRLASLEVAATCPCGCPSIDFVAKSGMGLTILSDYQFRHSDGHLGGVFVFAYGLELAGLEVWSIDGLGTPPLPAPDGLRSLG